MNNWVPGVIFSATFPRFCSEKFQKKKHYRLVAICGQFSTKQKSIQYVDNIFWKI